MMTKKDGNAAVRRVYARDGAPIDKILVRYLAARLGMR